MSQTPLTQAFPDLRQSFLPLTPQQVKQRLAAAGCTLKAWADANGYERELVSRVLTGANKAKYGKGYEVAIALGLKVCPRATAAAPSAPGDGFLPLDTVNALVVEKASWLHRSPEYKAGLAYILRRKLANAPKEDPPYRAGSVQFDAWCAGAEHGHFIVRDIRDGVPT